MPSVAPGDNHDRPDPTALRRTFAGFATRISGTAAPGSGHCETRGRFLVERPGPGELSASERTPGSIIRDSTDTASSLGRRLEDEQGVQAAASLQANALGLFLLQDRWRGRRRRRYVKLLLWDSGGSAVLPGNWSHLGRCPRERGAPPHIEPLSLRAGQPVRRAAEFPGFPAPSAAIPLIAQSPAAALTRRALTTLLPSSAASRRKSPNLSYVLHTVWLMVIDEREVRACLILHVAFGLSLPLSLGPLDPSVRIPDFAGSLSAAVLKKPAAHPYLHRILTLAMAKGMDSLGQMIIVQAAFPRSPDDPIFGAVRTRARAVLLPSYLLLAIGLRRCSLVKLMVGDLSGRRSNSSSGGVLLNQRSWLGLTPLLLAAATGGKAATIMVRTLVEAGADPTLGLGLVHMIRMQGYVHHLSRQPPTLVLDTRGPIQHILPLDMACATESCDAVISILGAMAARAQDHRQPLADCQLALLIQQDLDITIRLIKAGAPVSTARDHEGSTPLHWAARRGKTEMLAVLLHAGAPIDAVNMHGWTALHEAAWHGHADAIKYLISQGADCSLPDHRTGLTALQMALKSGIPSEDLCDYFAEDRSKEYAQQNDIDELLTQVDAFQLSSEVGSGQGGGIPGRKTKRKFLIEKIISLPRLLINSRGGGGDRETHCK